MKKRLMIIPAILAACCAVTFAGCTTSSTTTVIAMASNWYNYTTYKGIQTYFTKVDKDGNEGEYYSPEILDYDVALTEEGTNSSYNVAYAGGKYHTEFYATAFDADTLTDSSFKDGYDEAGTIIAYYYRTELTFDSVTFTYTGKDATSSDTVTFTGDTAITECYFLPCSEYLRPLYSQQTIVSHAPAAYTATSLDSSYEYTDSVYTTYYSYDGTQAVVDLVDNLNSSNSGKTEHAIENSYTFFDNSSTEIAIRAMSDLSSSLSQAIQLFIPKAGLETYGFVGSSTALGDEEAASITAVLQSSGLFAGTTATDDDGNEVTTDTVDTVAVSVEGTTNLSGVYQTYWYTAVSNKANNIGRATMVKISSPMAYNLGTLTYTLSDVESTLWDGTTD